MAGLVLCFLLSAIPATPVSPVQKVIQLLDELKGKVATAKLAAPRPRGSPWFFSFGVARSAAQLGQAGTGVRGGEGLSEIQHLLTVYGRS